MTELVRPDVEDSTQSLQLNNIQKANSAAFMLECSMSFQAGITVLLGANGSGKSTLIRILATVDRPQSGTISFRGRTLRSSADREWYRRRLGWLPQQFGYNPDSRVIDHLLYIGWIKGLRRANLLPSATNSLEAVGLTHVERVRLKRLSGGMLRRVGIAQTLMTRPSVLLLDEPTAGLDPEQRQNVYGALNSLSAQTVIVVATHLMEDVAALARSIATIKAGQCSRPVLLTTVQETAAKNHLSVESYLVKQIASSV